MTEAQAEDGWDVPSTHPRCSQPLCIEMPVAAQWRTLFSERRRHRGWCARHLRAINREVRDGRVWWLGWG